MSKPHVIFVLGMSVIASSLIAFSAIDRDPKLLYNRSASAPIGWYKVERASDYKTGDLVAAWLPNDTQTLAEERGYLPREIPVIKTIGAVAGDTFCITEKALLIEHKTPFARQSTDSQGRALPAVAMGCRSLSYGQVLLISDRVEHSFDSRYFGSIETANILGKAVLLRSDGESDSPAGRQQGGARGPGAQGKIKEHGTNPPLSHCLHIDFESTICNSIVLSDRPYCNDYRVEERYQFPVDLDLSHERDQ